MRYVKSIIFAFLSIEKRIRKYELNELTITHKFSENNGVITF